ncbi:tRNA pseudouridine(54/55) synthase Pus10 [Natronomonas sp. EA1]|uniref:tRNA pseudouridine(54/55) synthase Pus10 n=1 Tax=Natronomonas sp. EA1 TaxID=3421655 RepID=UPI003EBB3EA5
MTILETARELLATGPLCTACLGRPFADRSFGLRNDERGKALRVTANLEDDEPYEPDDDCWVCEGLCEEFDAYADRVVDALEGIEFRTYQLGTRVPPLLEENESLLREDAGLEEDAGEPLKSEFNREVGRRVGVRLEKEVDFQRPDVQVLLDLDEDTVEVQINSVAVYGRYRKLERDIPQTKWPCSNCHGSGHLTNRPCPECDGTGFRYPTSVQQEVAPTLVTALRGREGVFHGAGREDVDALMLGEGRPFVLEVKEPHRRFVDLETLEEEINEQSDGKIEVEGLRFATYDMVERVKEHDASKRYRAQVEFGASVTDEELQSALEKLQGATIEQRTPHRVDHRRADLVRTREVYDIEGELEDDTHATVDVHGAGGLYIKELISSDEGRTTPSLAGLLGVEAVVTHLDVLSVEGEAEAFEDPEFFY